MVTIRYIGISAFELITEADVKILIDPHISDNPLSQVEIKDFSDIDIILVTHGAPDHMGDAIELQRRTNATIVSDPAVRVHAWNKGVPQDKTIALLWGDQIEINGVKIKAVECRHISFFKSTNGYLTGLPLSFIVVPEPNVCIYNAGDTALFSDMKLIGTLYKPNIALMPIGGSPELTGGYCHLPPREAALATQWINPNYVIPTHYHPNTNDAERFKEYIDLLTPSTQTLILKPGDEIVYNSQTHRFT